MKIRWPSWRRNAKRPSEDEATNTIEEIRPASDGAPHSTIDLAGEPRLASTSVSGERTIPSVNRARSVRSTITHVLTFGTLALLCGGFLIWYYATQYARASEAQSSAKKQAQARTAGELKLPPLGRVDPPRRIATQAQAEVEDTLLGAPPPPPQPIAFAGHAAAPQPGTPPAKTPQQLALDRMLGQPVLLRQRSTQAHDVDTTSTGLPLNPGSLTPSTATTLGAMLQPTATPAARAQVLPTRQLLLAKGTFMDCTLETAIDSTFDGQVTCIGATDVYSADGKVVLLERGTKYIGEKRGEIKQGQARIFLLWNEARTPTGVVVPLASPGTDELGRTGVSGAVDNHFWERFGAAILISVIDGTLQGWAASQRKDGGGTSIVMNPQGARDVMTEVLKGTVGIPPTVVKNHGERIQVLAIRDVDFRNVYALRTDTDQR
jgi:type IV secretion system protein VirB10